MKKDRRKKNLFAKLTKNLILLVLDIALLAASTYAWFTANVTTDGNTMSAGIMTIDLVAEESYLESLGYSALDIEEMNLPEYTRNISYNLNAISEITQESYKVITNTQIPVLTLHNVEPGQIYPVSFKIANRGDLAATFSPYIEIIDSKTGLDSLQSQHAASEDLLLNYVGGENAIINNYGSTDNYLYSRGALTQEEYDAKLAKLNSNVDSSGQYNGKKLEDAVKVYVGNSRDDIIADNFIGTISQIVDGDIDSFDGYVLPRRAVEKEINNDVRTVIPSSVVLCDEEGTQFDILSDITDIDDFELLFVVPENTGNEYEYANIKMKVGVTANQVEYEYDGLNCLVYDKKLSHNPSNALFAFTNNETDRSYDIYVEFKPDFIYSAEDVVAPAIPFPNGATTSFDGILYYPDISSAQIDGSDNTFENISLEYSFDGNDWNDVNIFNVCTGETITSPVDTYKITIPANKRVYFRNKNQSTTLCTDNIISPGIKEPEWGDERFAKTVSSDNILLLGGLNFVIENPSGYSGPDDPASGVSVSGNIAYLLNKNGKTNSLDGTSMHFANIFAGNKYITDASNLSLKYTSLGSKCYFQMFANCDNLKYGPKLPADVLNDSCYESMFYGCDSLQTCPNLPATELADNCYDSMFAFCSSLSAAPSLPANDLKKSCYSHMFFGSGVTYSPSLMAKNLSDSCYKAMFAFCNRLMTAPALPATTLKDNCYCAMFMMCTSLNTGCELNATRLADNCYDNMFANCTDLVSFGELPATSLTNNCYHRMFYYCDDLISICPEGGLPANVATSHCYDSMFVSCSNLKSSPKIAANILEDMCMSQIFMGCEKLEDIYISFYLNSNSRAPRAGWLTNAGTDLNNDHNIIHINLPDPGNTDYTVEDIYASNSTTEIGDDFVTYIFD